MRKKYNYYVNHKKVERKEFIRQLEYCCQDIVDTDVVGCIGISMSEFNKKKFDKTLRDINKGTDVFFIDAGKCFQRKEAK